MRIPSQLGYVLGGSAALAMLAACSGGSTGTSPNLPGVTGSGTTPQSITRQAQSGTKSVLPPSVMSRVHLGTPGNPVNPVKQLPLGPFGFVSDFGNSEIYILSQSGTVVGTLTGSTGVTSPQGMASTNKHNLYGHNPALFVANSGADDILIYTSASNVTTLSNGGVEPSDVAVDNSGNVAAANIQTGTVTCFTGGATSPTSTISGDFLEVFFAAFDSSGNLFVDGFTNSGSVGVGEVVGGCASGTTITTLNTPTIGFPGGVQVANNGNIAIDDQEGTGTGPQIDNFTLSGTSLTLSSTTPLTGAGDPVTISLTPGSHAVLTADASNLNAALYPYPAGGSPTKTVTLPGASVPIGTAIYPSQQY